jgi:hypothetical protein
MHVSQLYSETYRIQPSTGIKQDDRFQRLSIYPVFLNIIVKHGGCAFDQFYNSFRENVHLTKVSDYKGSTASLIYTTVLTPYTYFLYIHTKQ